MATVHTDAYVLFAQTFNVGLIPYVDDEGFSMVRVTGSDNWNTMSIDPEDVFYLLDVVGGYYPDTVPTHLESFMSRYYAHQY